VSEVNPSSGAEPAPPPFSWASSHVAAIAGQATPAAPVIGPSDFQRVSPDLDVWDAWPLQHADGMPVMLAEDRSVWFALGAPPFPDPYVRHGHARIHLLHRAGARWTDLGPAMPEGFSPGSREWSGSAVLERDGRTVTLYFTATGRRGETAPTFEQRIFSASCVLDLAGPHPRLTEWGKLEEAVLREPAHYMPSDSGRAAVGAIKAFRDPAFFQDPADGAAYLVFAGSAADAASEFNGVIGMARADAAAPGGWRTLPPLVSANGLNNELERPHAIVHGGAYYLFWSTQSHVFDPSRAVGPTGLYGVVGSSILGPWRPLNGTGLVFANPPEAPRQAYSWLVLPDLSVTSFVDDWGAAHDREAPRRFGATFAPWLRLMVSGDRAGLAG